MFERVDEFVSMVQTPDGHLLVLTKFGKIYRISMTEDHKLVATGLVYKPDWEKFPDEVNK